MKEYKPICSRCVMDNSDQEIYFDDFGICNHCHRFDTLLHSRVNLSHDDTTLKKLIKKIKNSKSNEYDCIIGVSGGVDSTYVAYLVKSLGLNPLAIHFDNGWNSELAVSNIEKTLDNLGIDLYTYVIDWDYFKDIQKAFLKSNTPDGEIPTDHAINALLFKEASKRNIKYILNGMNFSTESMSVRTWAYGHSDWKYIKHIIKKFSDIKSFKKYPHFSIFDLFYYTFIKRIKVVSILNYIDYNKDNVVKLLTNELGWKSYEGKHYESIYTRFYQGNFLIKKFKIDKRRGHLSDLIRSNQIKRSDAINELKKDSYPSHELKKDDLEFVLKKLEISNEDFKNIINDDNKTFMNYPNNFSLVHNIKKIVNYMRKNNLYSK